jgi:hypothetical protein
VQLRVADASFAMYDVATGGGDAPNAVPAEIASLPAVFDRDRDFYSYRCYGRMKASVQCSVTLCAAFGSNESIGFSESESTAK